MNNARISIYALCRNREKAEKRFGNYLNDTNFSLIIQDVCDSLTVDVNFDYIIHAASNAHPLAFATTPVETMKANLLGSINILDYAKKQQVRKCMFVSSGEIYGKNDSSFENRLREDYSGYVDCTVPQAAYPESKRVSESLFMAYMREYGINTTIVRPWYIYGPTMIEESSKADAQFIKNAVDGVDIVMKSAGTQLRSYCYVSDAVTAMLYILLLGESGSAYNIANKNCTITIREFAETLAEIAGVKIIFENPSDVEKSGYSTVGNAVMDTRKLEGLGWKASYDIKNGLMQTLGIIKNN
jgi:nucleoside-diphosphate-sugar epimerase